MTRLLFAVLLLAGCKMDEEPAPRCALLQGDPNRQGEVSYICACQSGAPIPQECGGGIAPTEGTYAQE